MNPLPRTRSIGIGVVVAALMAAPSVNAQSEAGPPAAAEPADLAVLLDSADRNNPTLSAARTRVRAAAERPARVASLPDPMLGLVVRNVDFPDITYGEEMMSVAGVRFTQMLPTGGKRPARRAVAEQGIAVADARVEEQRRRIFREITQTWYRLDFVHHALEVVRETRALLGDLEATAGARYAVGEGLQQDVLKAQVERTVLLNRIVTLEQQRDALVTRLNELAGRPVDAPVAVMELDHALPELPDLEAVRAEAQRASASITVRSRQVEQQQAELDRARTDRSPDLSLSGAWMSRGGLPSIWELNVGITLPIRQADRQDRAIAEAGEELQARRDETRATVLSVEASIRDHALEVGRAYRLAELFEEGVIPQATLSLDAALAGYGVGKNDFLTVLDGVIKLLTYRLELERERNAALGALAALEEHVGRSLGASPVHVWERASDASEPRGGFVLPAVEEILEPLGGAR